MEQIQRIIEQHRLEHSLTLLQINDVLSKLPRLTEEQVAKLNLEDPICPICYDNFSAILTEEEIALAIDSPAHPVEELGLTQLSQAWQCGHVFCRKDIRKWVKEANDSCPVCRRSLLSPPGSNSLQSDNLGLASGEEPRAPVIGLHASFLADAGAELYDLSEVTTRYTDRNNNNAYSGMYS